LRSDSVNLNHYHSGLACPPLAAKNRRKKNLSAEGGLAERKVSYLRVIPVNLPVGTHEPEATKAKFILDQALAGEKS
jgi:hypothetical protein